MATEKQVARRMTLPAVEDETSPTDTTFTPSESQLTLLTHMRANHYECSIVDACTTCEIGRQTYYHWTHKPEFAKWWRDESRIWEAQQLPRVVGAMVKGATSQGKGASTDRKLYFDRNDPRGDSGNNTVPAPVVTNNFVEILHLGLASSADVRYHPELPSVREVLGRKLGRDGTDATIDVEAAEADEPDGLDGVEAEDR